MGCNMKKFYGLFIIGLFLFSSVGMSTAYSGDWTFNSDMKRYWCFGYSHVKDQTWNFYAILEDGKEQLLMKTSELEKDYIWKQLYVGEFRATKALKIDYYFTTQNAASSSWTSRSASKTVDLTHDGRWHGFTCVYFDSWFGNYDSTKIQIDPV